MDATSVLLLTSCVEVFALALRVARKMSYAAWALALGTAPNAAQAVWYVVRSARPVKLDLIVAALESIVIVLALVSLWRPASFSFWLAWAVNLILVAFFIYLQFFWHIFS